MSAAVTSPGFVEPVADAQATFRAVLDAMARPGILHQVGQSLTPPQPLDRATAAVLLTLVDNETPLWLDPVAGEARDWLAFHCGAAFTDDPGKAEFALAFSLPDLTIFSAGSHETPEGSATLIVQLPELGQGPRYRLSGPGLRGSAVLSAIGLSAQFITIWQRNHALFPRGVDLVLCSGTRLAALPRSVSIEDA
jgi:alpha-D-ribose 1-methylphosphonate 5-triphosphate synthase subunit PhnH